MKKIINQMFNLPTISVTIWVLAVTTVYLQQFNHMFEKLLKILITF